MNKQDAYRIVFSDILNHNINLFNGIYDAKNGNKHYMHGIQTLMEFIAYNVSEQDGEEFSYMFTNNLIASKQKKKGR